MRKEAENLNLNLVKEFDLTIVIPVTDWQSSSLRKTIESIKDYVESSRLGVDCLIAEIIPSDRDIELTLFQEIDKLPQFVTDLLGSQYFRYIAEVGFTARSLRKVLLNCRGERVVILGDGFRIGTSASRWTERDGALATIFPSICHKASIMHWGLLHRISDQLSGIPALSAIALASVSQIAFNKEGVIEILKTIDPFDRDTKLFESILKECLVLALLTRHTFIEIGASTAILNEASLYEAAPIEMEGFRKKLYGASVDCSTGCKVAADFALDFTYKAFHDDNNLDWHYPAKHFNLETQHPGSYIFRSVILSIVNAFRCGPSDVNETTQLLKEALFDLENLTKQKSQPTQEIVVTVISSLFREMQRIGSFLSHILDLEGFKIDHELIIVLPERDTSQGTLADFYSLFHTRVRVIQLDADPGIYSCWNIAIEHSRGKFITNANSDDRRSSRQTREIINALELHQGDVGSSAIIATKSDDFISNTDFTKPLEEVDAHEVWYRHGSSELIEEKNHSNFFLYNDKSEVVQCYNFPHSMPIWRKDIHIDLGGFDESSHGTYSDFALWLKAASSGKKFIHLSKVLGAYLIREDSHNRRNADPEKWLAIIQDTLPNKNIRALSDHVTNDIAEKGGKAHIRPGKAFDFGSQISQNYGNHRAGWSWVVSHLEDLHSPDSPIYCDLFLEKKFVWGNDEGDAWSLTAKPISKEWIGFLHVPPHVPCFFQYEQSNQQVFRTKLFKESFKFCRALIALTEYHADYLRQVFRDTHIQIYTIKHPTEIPDKSQWFTMEKFNECAQKKVVQVGWWLRKLNAVNYLGMNDAEFKPIMLGNCDWNKAIISYSERRYHGLTKPTTAEVIPFLDNDEYDQLLSASVVFIDFYDTSANNAIIECIARRTPALVPKHPAISEYLGPDYPLYFSCLDEVSNLLKDSARVMDATLYLGQESVQRLISYSEFRKSFESLLLKTISTPAS